MALKQQPAIGKTMLRIFKGAVFLIIVCLLIWGYMMPQDVTIYSPSSIETLEYDWVQLVDDNAISLEHIDQFIPSDVGTPIVIERIITDDMVNQCVLFYAEHQEVSVTIDGWQAYLLTCDGAAAFFDTPGRTWVNIPITTDMVGQTLRLELSSAIQVYHGLPSSIYCVAENDIYMVQLHFLFLRNTMAFLMLMLAVLSFTHALLWKPRKLRRFLFAAADLYLFVGLWLCAEVNILAIWFGRALLSTVMAMVFLRIIPVVFYHFSASLLPYHSWRTRLVEKLVWANLFLSLLLQFVFQIPMLHLVPLNISIISISCIIGFMEIVAYHRSGMQFLSFQFPCYAVSIMYIATLAECFIYIHYQSYGHLMGLPLSLGCFVHYIISYLALARTQSTTAQEKDSLEQTIANLHKQPLEQQINAHFLYNSLNTISAYCKEDSEQAYEAIRLLGQYMRSYTQLIGADGYVPLDEELDLMQTYMTIQNMRFENSIKFTVHNTCDDVLLPPLTLQPLVANAINHGIRKRVGSGHIQITACRKYNMVEIIVSDDGVGFNIQTLKSNSGVGLRNLERRIKAMGGSLTIESRQTKGTDVILMIPLEHTALEETEFDRFICR